jgi:hypothetical protein
VNFALNYFFDAITDVGSAIETCDEPNVLHYLARDMCYACLSMFREAITDLSIAINLKKDLLDVRLCYFKNFLFSLLKQREMRLLSGDTGLAFMDF